MAATRRARTVRGYISTFNNFSQYLSENHLEVDIRQINRSVIIGFIEYMAQKGWGAQHRSKQLETYNFYLKLAEKWMVSSGTLFDLPRRQNQEN